MRYRGIVIACLAILLATTLLTTACSHPSKEFTATVTDVEINSKDGLLLPALTVTVYFDNGEVIPFSSDSASGVFQIGKTYLVRCRQTYLNGKWHLDYLLEYDMQKELRKTIASENHREKS